MSLIPDPCVHASRKTSIHGLYTWQGLALSTDARSLYVSDTNHHQIKYVWMTDTGYQMSNISAIAGVHNVSGSSNQQAKFNFAGDLDLSPDGLALIVADTDNHLVRKISLD